MFPSLPLHHESSRAARNCAMALARAVLDLMRRADPAGIDLLPRTVRNPGLAAAALLALRAPRLERPRTRR